MGKKDLEKLYLVFSCFHYFTIKSNFSKIKKDHILLQLQMQDTLAQTPKDYPIKT